MAAKGKFIATKSPSVGYMSPKNPITHFHLVAQKAKAEVVNLDNVNTMAKAHMEGLGQELDTIAEKGTADILLTNHPGQVRSAKLKFKEKNEFLTSIVTELKRGMTTVLGAEQNELSRLKRQIDELLRKKQVLEHESERRVATSIMRKVDDIRLTE